ncbi:MAG: ABC transporter permease [Bacteroidetes bacterium]|nr:ABC transporter permease [Bacteroidota bacterium]
MDYRLFIARRYLHSRQRIPLITIMSGISMAGITVGVAALIIVLSVMNGFYDVVRDLLVSIDPHVRIEASDGNALPQNVATEIANQSVELPEVISAEPYTEGKALLVTVNQPQNNHVVIIRGVEADTISKGIISGEFDTSNKGMVMGLGLSQRLRLTPNSENRQAMLFSAQGLTHMLTRVFSPPQPFVFDVRGIYKLEETYDNTHVFIALDEAQSLFNMKNTVSGIDLRLSNIEDAAEIKQRLIDMYPENLQVQTWYELQQSLYDVMRLEKWGASLILILICVVAAFNIIGSLTMIVVEKRQNIGALRAMGATAMDIRNLFLIQGGLIGVIGTGAGFVIGLTTLVVQKYFELIPILGAESFVIDAYPVSIQMLDLLLIGASSFGLCLLAALYPAWRASQGDPSIAVAQDR